MTTRLFSKVKQGATRFFGKIGQEAPRILGKISQGLSSGSSLFNKIADIASNIGSNPITMAVAPELSAGLSSLTGGIRAGSNLLGQGSALTNKNTYRGDVNQVSNKILERTKKLKDDSKNVIFQ